MGSNYFIVFQKKIIDNYNLLQYTTSKSNNNDFQKFNKVFFKKLQKVVDNYKKLQQNIKQVKRYGRNNRQTSSQAIQNLKTYFDKEKSLKPLYHDRKWVITWLKVTQQPTATWAMFRNTKSICFSQPSKIILNTQPRINRDRLNPHKFSLSRFFQKIHKIRKFYIKLLPC